MLQGCRATVGRWMKNCALDVVVVVVVVVAVCIMLSYDITNIYVLSVCVDHRDVGVFDL